MALLDIHLLGSPPLRARSAELGAVDDRTRQFVADLFETMDAAKGLASRPIRLA